MKVLAIIIFTMCISMVSMRYLGDWQWFIEVKASLNEPLELKNWHYTLIILILVWFKNSGDKE